MQQRLLAQRRRDEPREARGAQRLGVTRDEVDEVVALERQWPVREQLVAEHGDRPLAVAVHVRPGAARRLPGGVLDVRVDPELRESLHCGAARLVAPERREELAAPGEQRELPRDDRAAARRLTPDLACMDDRAGLGQRGTLANSTHST